MATVRRRAQRSGCVARSEQAHPSCHMRSPMRHLLPTCPRAGVRERGAHDGGSRGVVGAYSAWDRTSSWWTRLAALGSLASRGRRAAPCGGGGLGRSEPSRDGWSRCTLPNSGPRMGAHEFGGRSGAAARAPSVSALPGPAAGIVVCALACAHARPPLHAACLTDRTLCVCIAPTYRSAPCGAWAARLAPAPARAGQTARKARTTPAPRTAAVPASAASPSVGLPDQMDSAPGAAMDRGRGGAPRSRRPPGVPAAAAAAVATVGAPLGASGGDYE